MGENEKSEQAVFTDDDVAEIVRLVGIDCNDVQELKGALNAGAELFGRPVKQEGKHRGPSPKEIIKYYDGEREAILRAIVRMEHYSARIISRYSFLDGAITPATVALYAALECSESDKKRYLDGHDWRENRDPGIPFRRLNPKTIFVGSYLPWKFELYFNRPWGISRAPSGGEPYGPGIRFIQSVLSKMGAPMNPEAIYAAKRAMDKKKVKGTPS